MMKPNHKVLFCIIILILIVIFAVGLIGCAKKEIQLEQGTNESSVADTKMNDTAEDAPVAEDKGTMQIDNNSSSVPNENESSSKNDSADAIEEPSEPVYFPEDPEKNIYGSE